MKRIKVYTQQQRRVDVIWDVEVPDDWPDEIDAFTTLTEEQTDKLWEELLPFSGCEDTNLWVDGEELRSQHHP